MKKSPRDLLQKAWMTLSEASSFFRRNNDLTASSSLAFSATLALIPALFLLTFLLGAAIGSSARALAQTREFMTQLIPAYSQVILKEVDFIARHKGAIGIVNLFILFWSITPLVADMRVSVGAIFRKKPTRPFLLEKLFDAAISMVFLVGLSAVAVAGVAFTIMERIQPLRQMPGCLKDVAFFMVVTGVICALYFTFSKRARFRHLLAGALAASLLWFALRPAFHLFLTFNPGYGFAFGSFKSLFVIIIWIYISMVLFLFGAEIAAGLGRKGAAALKSIPEDRAVPPGVFDRRIVRFEKGSIVFKEGDPGSGMFYVLKGKVSIREGGREIEVVPQGKSFGSLSFLLPSVHRVKAVAIEDVELVMLTSDNLAEVMKESPELIIEMLREAALREKEQGH
jgi:membrane protein